MSAPAQKVGCWCGGRCPHLPKIRAAEQSPGKLHAAETVARRALTAAPDCVEAHRALAYVLGQNNRAAAAGDHLARARAISGELSPALAFQIALNLRNQAKVGEAIAAAIIARELAPENIQAHVAVAVAHEAAGDLDGARGAISEAEKRFGARALPLRWIDARVIGDGGDYQAAVDRLAGDDLTPVELFDRGKYRERLADYAGAWSDWMTAKRIQRETEKLQYDGAAIEQKMAALREVAYSKRFKYLRGCDMPAERPWPLFITGFPRSGTTMLESVLATHSRVVAGDELMFVPELVERLPLWLNARAPYPRALMATGWPENETVIPLLSRYYIGKSLQKIGVRPWIRDTRAKPPVLFTDKMPSNELHWPLLSLLFPQSPIIHCRRHPLDILLSCMSNHLVHGAFNAVDLAWCARHYALTDDLTAHYRDKLQLPMLLEVRYETFVADHHAGVDAILKHARLAAEPACYDFHLNGWHSRTLSYRQIKEPAHARSVGRYKPFLEYLRPIVPIVQATLDREGYTL